MNVFSIHGYSPEVLAYAMAKYSRSSLSLAQSIDEISKSKAAEFLNTFYFAYGHRSIADLAHVPMAVEDISILAAVELVEEQLWDGQERSTRYQDFGKRIHYKPSLRNNDATLAYERAITDSFNGYEALSGMTQLYYKKEYPKPEDMKDDAYERTIKARAFDVARYLLPMATNTSVGQVTNARTLEKQISRLRASIYPEVITMGANLQLAARNKYSLTPEGMEPILVSPTLVKYAEESEQVIKLRRLMKTLIPAQIHYTRHDMGEISHYILYSGGKHGVKAFTAPFTAYEIEAIATLIFEHSQYSYEECLFYVSKVMSLRQIQDFIKKVIGVRGGHDELVKAFRTGGITFEVKMDIGGMRDMHRHRRCQFIKQPYPSVVVTPARLEAVPDFIQDFYKASFDSIIATRRKMADHLISEEKEERVGDYLLPLGTNCRFLMKMDPAEVVYIAELRSKPAGHISYRRVVWEMFHVVERIFPSLADETKKNVVDPDSPLDFFKR